jgi:hypothetical protein
MNKDEAISIKGSMYELSNVPQVERGVMRYESGDIVFNAQPEIKNPQSLDDVVGQNTNLEKVLIGVFLLTAGTLSSGLIVTLGYLAKEYIKYHF